MVTAREDFGHDEFDGDDRRAYNRRKIDEVERRVSEVERQLGELKLRYEMFILAFNSRYDELKGGQKILHDNVEELRSLKDRMMGAFGLIVLLGVTGIIGGIIAIVKAIKGP